MLLSTQTEFLGYRHGDAEAIRLLKKAGFDAFDFSFFRMSAEPDYEMNRPGFREYAKELRTVADQCGVVCNQAHAPFASSKGDAAWDEERFQAILRSMEAAAILGAKAIVVHPKHHLPYQTHAAELREMNLEFYRSLIPYCEEFGIQVAAENMWQHNRAAGRIIDSTCSRPEEFCEYLDALDSPWIVGCLDVGHTALTDEDLPAFVRTMGRNRLRALHVHDNDLLADSHTLPYTQKIEFDGFLTALGEIGYQGDFTFEADCFLERIPAALEQDALAFMEKVGRYMMSEIAAARP